MRADGNAEECIPRPFEIGFGLFWVLECANIIPERGGGQEGVSPMAAYMGCDDTVAVANKKGWYDTKDLRWEALIDRRKSVQHKADVRVYCVGRILDLRNPGQI